MIVSRKDAGLRYTMPPQAKTQSRMTMEPRIALFILLFLVCVVHISCGYRFTGSGELPGDIKSICIKVFENRTAETGLENVITNDLNYEVTRSGRAVLTDMASSDAVLTGIIQSMTVESISHRDDYSLERRVEIKVDLKLTASDGSVLWAVRDISDKEDYDIMDDKLATEKNRKDAIEELSKRLAETIYNRMTEDF